MRIGLISDTHDQAGRTAEAVALFGREGVGAVVHCGDLTGPAVVDAFAALAAPTYFVLGNNDYDEAGLRRAAASIGGVFLGRSGVFEVAGKTLAATHGDSPSEMRRLALARPDYLFYGHSHVADDVRDGPTRRINPGALHRAAVYTVGVLDLAADALTTFRVGPAR